MKNYLSNLSYALMTVGLIYAISNVLFFTSCVSSEGYDPRGTWSGVARHLTVLSESVPMIYETSAALEKSGDVLAARNLKVAYTFSWASGLVALSLMFLIPITGELIFRPSEKEKTGLSLGPSAHHLPRQTLRRVVFRVLLLLAAINAWLICDAFWGVKNIAGKILGTTEIMPPSLGQYAVFVDFLLFLIFSVPFLMMLLQRNRKILSSLFAKQG